MQKELTITQLLRLAVQRYWELLWVDHYYERTKKYEWRIKNAKDRSEKWQKKQLDTYRAGIDAIEQGYISKYDALLYTYKKHTRLQTPKKRTQRRTK